MIKIEVEYKTVKTDIQAKFEDKMRQVFSKFTQKAQLNINNIYFIYSGNIINLDLTVKQIINTVDKERSIMSIVAIDKSNESGNNNKKISPYIICPICKEPARIEIKDYRIKIYNCRKGHTIENILIKDFQSSQMIDESLIKCDQCKTKNKSNTYNNEMYICNKCNMNLCPLCKSNHDKNHKIINYEQKYYICNIHNKEYNSYCETCHTDLCIFCKKEHKEHKIISYDDIIPEDIPNQEFIKFSINAFILIVRTKINMIIDRLNKVMKNIEIYFKLFERNFLNYDINNINYNILRNINYMNIKDNKFHMEDLNSIIIDNSYKQFIPRILKMYNEMNKNEIDLVYNIPNNEKKIKIFGNEFVGINKDICKIIYKNKEYELTEYFNCQDEKENLLKINLKGINNAIVLDNMLEGCSQLSPLSNFSNWDTTYAVSMNHLFLNCKCLKLPDVSKLNTSNVMSMESMFEGCSSLKSIPDISKWDTSKVFSMRNMFKGCSSLNSIPDISKWDISYALKCKDFEGIEGGIEGMFDGCSNSLNIPEKFKI